MVALTTVTAISSRTQQVRKLAGLVGLRNERGLQGRIGLSGLRGPSDLVDVTLFGELSLRPAAPLVAVEPVDPDVILPSVAWVWDDYEDDDLAEQNDFPSW